MNIYISLNKMDYSGEFYRETHIEVFGMEKMYGTELVDRKM